MSAPNEFKPIHSYIHLDCSQTTSREFILALLLSPSSRQGPACLSLPVTLTQSPFYSPHLVKSHYSLPSSYQAFPIPKFPHTKFIPGHLDPSLSLFLWFTMHASLCMILLNDCLCKVSKLMNIMMIRLI